MYQRKRYSRLSRPQQAPPPPPPPKNPRPAPPPSPPTSPPPSHGPFPFSEAHFRPSSPPIPTSPAPILAADAEGADDQLHGIGNDTPGQGEAVPIFRTPQNEAWLRAIASDPAAAAITSDRLETDTLQDLLPLPPALINPPAQLDTEAIEQAQEERSPQSFFGIADRVGRLKVETFLQDRSAPVAGVHLIISNTLDGQEFRYYEADTDSVGIAEGFLLPATNRDRTLSPDQAAPYTIYQVEAQKEGFLPLPPFLVQIYENVTTVLPILMQLDFGKEAN